MITDPSALRPFPFPVRLFHRESIHSFTGRLLAANFSDSTHLKDLVDTFQQGLCITDRRHALVHMLAVKTGRGALLDSAHFSDWMTGRKPITAETTVHARYGCVLCTQGQMIRQDPHFDDIVCVHHRRWLGMWGHPAQQHTIGVDVVRAQLTFAKLRKQERINVRLYRITARALAVALHPALAIEDAEPLVFVETITLIDAITRPRFASALFDTRAPFAEAHMSLQQTVQQITPAADPVTRALWIYLHPTITHIRNALGAEARFRPNRAEQFPLSDATAAFITAGAGELEPIGNYFAVTGDTPATAGRLFSELDSLRLPNSPMTPAHHTCPNGHEFDYLPDMYDLATPWNDPEPSPPCGLCTTRQVDPGDDFASVRPDLAELFDTHRNGGLTAHDVAASSQTPYLWLCPAGHSHRASPFNKASGDTSCPFHSNRIVVLGINSFIDTHPDLAARSAETWDDSWSTARNSSGSKTLAQWTCDEGHKFTARFGELTSGKVTCNICKRKRNVVYDKSFAARWPEKAKLWHPTRNGGLTASDVTPGEKKTVWWLCEEGHDNEGRVDKRAQGQQCGICADKVLRPGVNDLATREPVLTLEYHPDMNALGAREIFPSDHVLTWKCLPHDHVHQQTVQHRRESGGCPLCVPEERLVRYLENLKLQATLS